ncbi:hypothetical protein GGP41_009475 [Bipolaris sorokiniana]|uniref:Uncharacterized protein n=1 Tax=Cochliobolus sativus TaxID=45130 RepID=A0A8H5ZAA1_COCSA|nr:hypothetical protein GGP41_009475 [Bipolaris sorokiniana]
MFVALSPIPHALKRSCSAQPKPAVAVRVATRSSISCLLNWLRGYHDRGSLDHRMLHAALLCSIRKNHTSDCLPNRRPARRPGMVWSRTRLRGVGSQARCGMPVEIPRTRIGESSVLRAVTVVGKRSRLGCYPNPV